MDVKYFVREKALYLGQVVQNFFVSFQWILLFILCVIQFWIWIMSNYSKQKQWTKNFMQEKLMLQLTFNARWSLNGF